MKSRSTISNKFLKIAIGLIVGLFVLTQTVIYSTPDTSNDPSKEQSDVPENGKQQLSLSEAVPSAITQINLDFQSFLIEEVEFDDDNSEVESPAKELISLSNKALKIILRRIISPNAP